MYIHASEIPTNLDGEQLKTWLLGLAKSTLDTAKDHEESYVDKTDLGQIGGYGKTIATSAALICDNDTIRWIVSRELSLRWNEALDWARAMKEGVDGPSS